MDRTLDYVPFFTAVAVVSACLAVCFVNMYLLSRHKRSPFTLFVHAVSLLAVLGAVCCMMGTAVFVLPLSGVYLCLSRLSFLLFFTCLFAGVSVLAVRKNRTGRVNRSQDIAQALSIIEDIVFVADMDGVITQVNHPAAFSALFGKINTMNELDNVMTQKCCLFQGSADNGYAARELIFIDTGAQYIYRLSPITKDGKPMGYTAVLEDVAAVRQSETILREQNDYLRQANEKLSSYVKVAGALEAEKERLQILEHVQATLIRDVEEALNEIRRTEAERFTDGSYRAAAKALAAQLRDVYKEVRGTISRIAGKEA